MLASDVDLCQAMKSGLLRIEPTEPCLMQPASVDLRLDDRFRYYQAEPGSILDPAVDATAMMTERIMARGDPYLLPPQGFALGGTLERVALADRLAGKLEGKSSLGRLGLFVHATAGWIDPGFEGYITLELFNATPYPIRLWPGMRIAQLAVFTLGTRAGAPYGSPAAGSHYQDQPRGAQPSQGWRSFRAWPTPGL